MVSLMLGETSLLFTLIWVRAHQSIILLVESTTTADTEKTTVVGRYQSNRLEINGTMSL